MFTPIHFESLWFCEQKKTQILFTHSARKKKKKSKHSGAMNAIHFQKNFMAWLACEWKLRRKLAIAKSKWKWNKKRINRPKYKFIYIDGIQASFVNFYFRYYQMESIPSHIDIYAGQCINHCSRCIYQRYRCDNIASLSFSNFRSILLIYSIYCLLGCLVLIFSAWNNQIIRPKCLLSQMSSLNQ